MDKIKRHLLFQTVSIILIVAFITLDISWAYQPDNTSRAYALAVPSVFQRQSMSGEAQNLRGLPMTDIGLLTAVYTIGRYLLGDSEEGKAPLPLKYLEQVLTAELGRAIEDIDLSKVAFKDGVVLIPYVHNGNRYIIQVASINSEASKGLVGYELPISDKYAVKVVAEGYIAPQIAVTKAEPVIETTDPGTKVTTILSEPRRSFRLRPIISYAMVAMVMFTSFFAKPITTPLMAQTAAPASSSAQNKEIESLIRKFKSTNFDTWGDAFSALVKIGKPAVEPLIAALKDSNQYVRVKAADVLSQLKDPRSVGPLIAALKDREPDVRRAAAYALGVFKDPRAVEPLIAALGDSDPYVHRNAASALAQLKDPRSVEPLIAMLKDSNPYVRKRAVNELAQLKDPRSVEPLITTLGDSDPNVRAETVSALLQLEDPRAVEPLIAALKDSDFEVRLRVAYGLTQLKDPRAVIAMLGNSNSYFREKAAEELAQLKDLRSVEPLIAALGDSEWLVRANAAYALGELKDPRAVEPLIAALKDSDEYVRRKAAKALAQLKDPRSVEPLIAMLKDSNPYVRVEAAYVLSQLKDPRSVEPFIVALGDSYTYVRSVAISALGDFGDSTAIAPLRNMFGNEDDFFIDYDILQSLQELGGTKGMEKDVVLYEQLFKQHYLSHSDDTYECQYANYALGRIKHKHAKTMLLENLETVKYWQAPGAAARNLVNFKDDPMVVTKLIKALNGGSRDYTWCESRHSGVAWALGKIGDQKAVAPLIKELLTVDESDIGGRISAAEALGKLGGAEASQALMEASKDKNERVSTAAKEALSAMKHKAARQNGHISKQTKPEASTKKSGRASASGIGSDRPVLVHNSQLKAQRAEGMAAIRRRAFNFRSVVSYAMVTLVMFTSFFAKPITTPLMAQTAAPISSTTQNKEIESLIREIQDTDYDIRWAAANSLAKIGQPAVEALISVLNDKKLWSMARAATAVALGDIKDSRAVESLINSLADESSHVRMCAAAALGDIKDPRSVEPLIKVLAGDQDGLVRQLASQALGKFNDRRAVVSLMRSLTDKDSGVRSSSARSLGKLKDARAIEPLIGVLDDKEGIVREAAAYALGELRDPRSIEPLVKLLNDKDPFVFRAAANALSIFKSQIAFDLIIKKLKDESNKNSGFGVFAAEALGKFNDRRAVEPLVGALSDDVQSVRESAAKALGELGYSEAIEPLIKAMREPGGLIAAQSLAKIGQPAVNPLMDALNDSNSTARGNAAQALGILKISGAADAMISMLSDIDTYPRMSAAWALGELKESRAVELLIKALSGYEDNNVRKVAAGALIKIGRPAVRPLIDALSGQDGQDELLRDLAAKTLGEIKDPMAVEPLIKSSADRDTFIRASSVEALGKIKDARAVDALIKALEDQFSNISSAAADALGQIGDTRAIAALTKAARSNDLLLVISAEKALEKIKHKSQTPATEGKRPRTSASGIDILHSFEPHGLIDQELAKQPQAPAGEGRASASGKVTELFEIVEATINNTRARLVKEGNELETFLSVGDKAPIDKAMTTADIKRRLEKALAAAEKAELPARLKSATEDIRKNLNQLEADGIVGTVITLARKAKRERQKLIVGFETDWIPGYNEKHSLQHDVLNPLVQEIESLDEALRSMGLDNVIFVHKNGGELADSLLSEADRTKTRLSNVIALASNATINSDSFAALRSTPGDEKAFLAGIDATELEKYYSDHKDSAEQLNIKIMEMLSITLELAAGKEPPNMPIILSYDKARRMVIFLPRAEPIDYQELKRIYNAHKTALQAA